MMGIYYIQGIITSKIVLDFRGKIADRTSHESKQNGSRWNQEEIFKQSQIVLERCNVRLPTYPEPGVIATKPAIAPEQNPTIVHLFSVR
jgi:hypothetical protein